MKERPILFTPENAQKCFEGVKTQTRRLVKFPHSNPLGQWESTTVGGLDGGKNYKGETAPESVAMWHTRTGDHLFCPYGVVGDRLWIRESWQEKAWSLTELNRAGFLSAPKKPHETYLNQDLYAIHKGGYNAAIGDSGKWTPSIHMPRWACRTVVEIIEVRVQRVQEIVQLDALHEGCDGPDHKANFMSLWNSINGLDSWDKNPWVWALTFKKVTA